MAQETSVSQGSSRQMRFKDDDYECIISWLENKENFNSLFGADRKTRLDGVVATKSTVLNKLAIHVNDNSLNRLTLTGSLMYQRLRHYKQKFKKAAEFLKQPGAGFTELDREKGIVTLSQKLNSICPFYERMDGIFGEKPNLNPATDNYLLQRDEAIETTTVTEVATSDTVSQSTFQPRRNRHQYSTDLEESVDNRKASSKRRRIDGNVEVDTVDTVEAGNLERINWEKEKLKLMEERAARSRRIDLENAKLLKTFELEETLRLKEKEMELVANLKEKEISALLQADLALLTSKARLDLLVSLISQNISSEEIDRRLKIFKEHC